MNIHRLAWDSDFFGYEVGSCSDFQHSEQDLIAIENSSYQLIYLFLNQALPALPKTFFLADEKLILSKRIESDQEYSFDFNISQIKVIDQKLLSLAMQSGVHSRFKIDPNFKHNEFERLYKKWIENSFAEKKHQKVLGYFENETLLGFVSIAEKLGVLNIGLIAVDQLARGKGIGSSLLQWVFNYAKLNQFEQVHVVTQAANRGALNFYEQHSFEIISRTFLYHIWKLH